MHETPTVDVCESKGDSSSSEASNHDTGLCGSKDSTSGSPIPQPKAGEDDKDQYATGFKLAMIVISLQLTNFCIAVDNTIIATAIPRITDHFGSLGDVGWYGSAYLLFVSGFQLFFGRLYSFLNMKWLFIACVVVFEIGSLISAVAPTSAGLIAGRAISGFGASGIFTGALTTISTVVPLARRGMFIGLITAVYGVASIVGPLLGGALTDHASWRWCFYINLPLGGVTILILIFCLQFPPSPPKETKTWKEYVLRFDPIGTILFAPSIICLLIALQWGGTTYAWGDGRIIALFVVFGVLLLGFAVVQPLMKDNATLNTKVMTSRHTMCAALYAFCVSASFFVMAYFIPIWFQAIRGASAVRSGIDLLPFMISIILSIMSGGFLVSKIGWYNPFMFAPITLGAVGAGLIYTWDIDTPTSRLIGYQILFGLGVGLGIQQAIVAVQSGKNIDIPSGIALLCFAENFGGAVFVSVAQNLWANKLAEKLQNIANIDPARVVKTGATEINSLTQDPDTLRSIRVAYNDALSQPFLVALILLCIATIGTLGVDWNNIKAKDEKKGDTEQADDARAAANADEAAMDKATEKGIEVEKS
ncbi:MFS general substrate transporter [Karstenula rhodostoma CBS 690.94]|uniref:MFS general substrate transporter n=1 Tax=Karstenula rhodostoma CBS 690.94 TaxID=1392251 RepID=A0A9P4U5N4_9PLEO|nr:MFS general substrate transporter [Karstenula rhodostoma CBS 690.94]